MSSAYTLPRQPEIVREYFRRQRRLEAALFALPGTAAVEGLPAVMERGNDIMQTLLAAVPADVAVAYETWRTEYNATVARIKADRQAALNSAEVARVRAASCPSCFATHAGEC